MLNGRKDSPRNFDILKRVFVYTTQIYIFMSCMVFHIKTILITCNFFFLKISLVGNLFFSFSKSSYHRKCYQIVMVVRAIPFLHLYGQNQLHGTFLHFPAYLITFIPRALCLECSWLHWLLVEWKNKGMVCKQNFVRVCRRDNL